MIELNRAWFIFYGSLFGMSPRETLSTLYGEMRDLIDCKAINEGRATLKKRKLTYDEVMRLE